MRAATLTSFPSSSPDTIAELLQRIAALEQKMQSVPDTNALCMVVFSGELDKLLASFVIATGAAACGMKVSMFFTFWGTAALKKKGPQSPGKTLVEKAFGWMLPGGFDKRKLSKLDMGGMGRMMMAQEMKKKNVSDLPTLIALAQELAVQLYICEMSMSLMGITREELIEDPDMKQCGVAHFLTLASEANTTLFI